MTETGFQLHSYYQVQYKNASHLVFKGFKTRATLMDFPELDVKEFQVKIEEFALKDLQSEKIRMSYKQ